MYRPNVYVAPSGQPPGYRTIPISASHPKMASAWHIFDPEVIYWAPRQVMSIWGPTPIFITENGCAAADQISEDGNIHDTDRVMFLRACLAQLQRATSEGVPVHGYFHWSAQDNLEWRPEHPARSSCQVSSAPGRASMTAAVISRMPGSELMNSMVR